MSVLNDFEKQYHINLKNSDISENVILTGDPDRVEEIASHLDNACFIAQKREFITWSGYKNDKKITVVSTGIGGPSAAICLTELVGCGAKNFIRVGTCGGMSLDVISGDLVIPSAAIRGDGTSVEHLPIEFPAVSDFSITSSLVSAANEYNHSVNGNNYNIHIGVVQSKDSFYSQHSPDKQPVSEFLNNRWNAYVRGNCLASEMECASLFIVGQILKVRVGAVLTVVWNQERVKHGLENKKFSSSKSAIEVALTAICDF